MQIEMKVVVKTNYPMSEEEFYQTILEQEIKINESKLRFHFMTDNKKSHEGFSDKPYTGKNH